jgi:hypothetical protein
MIAGVPQILELTPEQVCDVRGHLLAEVVRGPQRSDLLRHLFDAWLDPKGPRHLTIKDIQRACRAFAQSDSRAIRAVMSHLKKALRAHFNEYSCVVRLNILEGYQPQFVRNVRPTTDGLAARFWAPYRTGTPVRILYPEPPFYKDGNDTYLRNPVDGIDAGARLRYLSYVEPLEQTYSFVPSGVVEGMLFLLEAFQRLGIEFRTTAVRSEVEANLVRDEPLVVLGTPATTQLVGALEARTSAHTTRYSVEVHSPPKTYADKSKPEEITGIKYALLTRRVIGRQPVTILSAAHGRTVQALANALTDEEDLAALAKKCRTTDAFPEQLQAIFEVETVDVTPEPFAASIRPIRVLKA